MKPKKPKIREYSKRSRRRLRKNPAVQYPDFKLPPPDPETGVIDATGLFSHREALDLAASLMSIAFGNMLRPIIRKVLESKPAAPEGPEPLAEDNDLPGPS